MEWMRIRPDISIILCTGFSHSVDRDTVLSMGIQEFIMKPLVMRDLALAVRRVLDGENRTGVV